MKPDCIKETRHFKSVKLHLVLVPHLRFTSMFYLFSAQIWMLTGDKLETATCIAKSSHLVSRNQDIHVFRPVCCFYIVSFPVLWCNHNAPWHKAFISSRLIVLRGSRAGLKQGRSPSGAQRLQKETWLCSGHLWRLLRGTTTQHSTQPYFLAQQMMLRMQPNRQWENKKYFSAKTNVLRVQPRPWGFGKKKQITKTHWSFFMRQNNQNLLVTAKTFW